MSIDDKLHQARKAHKAMSTATPAQYEIAAEKLAECFDTIDYLLKAGGPLPKEWQAKREDV